MIERDEEKFEVDLLFSFSAFHLEVFYMMIEMYLPNLQLFLSFYYMVFWRFPIMLQNSNRRLPQRVASKHLVDSIPYLTSRNYFSF